MKVLLVEDDAKIAAYLAQGLREAGHLSDTASNGRDGLFLAATGEYEVLVIDRMLPELDGLGLVRTLRASGRKTPVLFLTALGQVAQRVEGFEAGGDDYLVKPFAFSEFFARLEALARRPPLQDQPSVLTCAGLALDRLKRTVSFGQAPIDLNPREFALLEVLLLNAGNVVTRTMMLEKVWGFHFDPRTNIVETHMSRLRTKLGPAKVMIETVRGAGYVVRPAA